MKRRDFLWIVGVSAIWGIFFPRVLASQEKNRDKRWVMLVDVSVCAKNRDCEACIKACHETHNVPNVGGSKEQIKWIWFSKFEKVFETEIPPIAQKKLGSWPVILMCNHCENPPCVKVCPTSATWKRKDGIVMMDYHRCIGCRYCMAACPYGARSFNWRDNKRYVGNVNYDFPLRNKGVVEKCNFCEERIAKGLQPKCVETCESRALKFGNLYDADSSVSKVLKERTSLVRKGYLGTNPNVFYLL
ncbi:MAG: 4Fe-4S dicluster domain-containing protein [Deltaproteobacteria bacterium]|nr:4Fe-4S dicluster domain-containing protein [Deltaproteobacteria bacterium]